MWTSRCRTAVNLSSFSRGAAVRYADLARCIMRSGGISRGMLWMGVTIEQQECMAAMWATVQRRGAPLQESMSHTRLFERISHKPSTNFMVFMFEEEEEGEVEEKNGDGAFQTDLVEALKSDRGALDSAFLEHGLGVVKVSDLVETPENIDGVVVDVVHRHTHCFIRIVMQRYTVSPDLPYTRQRILYKIYAGEEEAQGEHPDLVNPET